MTDFPWHAVEVVAHELEIFTDLLQRLEKVSGEVRVSFRKQDIVRVSKDGNMVIDTKGVRGVSLASLSGCNSQGFLPTCNVISAEQVSG